jgi:hypothetical protein
MKITETKHIFLTEQDLMDIIIPALLDRETITANDNIVIETEHFTISVK